MCSCGILPIMDFSSQSDKQILDWLNSSLEGVRNLIRQHKDFEAQDAINPLKDAVLELQKRLK
jgi:hypothetical protein